MEGLHGINPHWKNMIHQAKFGFEGGEFIGKSSFTDLVIVLIALITGEKSSQVLKGKNDSVTRDSPVER